MVFLFQDQNQGTRNETAHAKECVCVTTVLFHPDFNRRLRNRTESADPSSQGDSKGGRRSRAWAFALTAGGEFHPALRTSTARNGRAYLQLWRKGGTAASRPPWGKGMSPCLKRDTFARDLAKKRQESPRFGHQKLTN